MTGNLLPASARAGCHRSCACSGAAAAQVKRKITGSCDFSAAQNHDGDRAQVTQPASRLTQYSINGNPDHIQANAHQGRAACAGSTSKAAAPQGRPGFQLACRILCWLEGYHMELQGMNMWAPKVLLGFQQCNKTTWNHSSQWWKESFHR